MKKRNLKPLALILTLTIAPLAAFGEGLAGLNPDFGLFPTTAEETVNDFRFCENEGKEIAPGLEGICIEQSDSRQVRRDYLSYEIVEQLRQTRTVSETKRILREHRLLRTAAGMLYLCRHEILDPDHVNCRASIRF